MSIPMKLNFSFKKNKKNNKKSLFAFFSILLNQLNLAKFDLNSPKRVVIKKIGTKKAIF
jgi:hypothetical protein